MPLDTTTYQSTNTTFNAEFRVWQYFDSAHTYVQAEVGGRVSSWEWSTSSRTSTSTKWRRGNWFHFVFLVTSDLTAYARFPTSFCCIEKESVPTGLKLVESQIRQYILL